MTHRYMSHCCRYALSNKMIGAVLVDTRQKWRVRMLEELILEKVAQKGMHSLRGKLRLVGTQEQELHPNELVKWHDAKFNAAP